MSTGICAKRKEFFNVLKTKETELLTTGDNGRTLYLVMTVKAQSRGSRMGMVDGLSPRERQVYDLIVMMRSQKPRGTQIRQQELADELKVNKAVISRTLQLLRVRGLVGRNDEGSSTKIVKRLRRKTA